MENIFRKIYFLGFLLLILFENTPCEVMGLFFVYPWLPCALLFSSCFNEVLVDFEGPPM